MQHHEISPAAAVVIECGVFWLVWVIGGATVLKAWDACKRKGAWGALKDFLGGIALIAACAVALVSVAAMLTGPFSVVIALGWMVYFLAVRIYRTGRSNG